MRISTHRQRLDILKQLNEGACSNNELKRINTWFKWVLCDLYDLGFEIEVERGIGVNPQGQEEVIEWYTLNKHQPKLGAVGKGLLKAVSGI